MTTPHPPEELIERLRARSERHRDQSGDMLFYGQRDQDLDEAADLLTLQASRIKKLEEALRRVCVEAYETIPPDGKDAAFHALSVIYRIAADSLSHDRRPRMTDQQIKRMTERFLSWKLPENFNHMVEGLEWTVKSGGNEDCRNAHPNPETNK